MNDNSQDCPWPELPTAAWRETCATLQLWTQIVGKIRLAKSPWLNHSWHVTLYVTPRGLTTSPMPDGTRTFQINFDFVDHRLRISTSDGGTRQLCTARPIGRQLLRRHAWPLLPNSALHVAIDEMPNELPDPVRFSRGQRHASYDPDAVAALPADPRQQRPRLQAIPHRLPRQGEPGAFLLGQFRSRGNALLGPPRAAPSRRRTASARCGRLEAYSHEVSSAGFWPGSGAIDYPAFYSYAYPEPPGFRAAKVRPDAAFFSEALGEFILPYDAVRTAADPDEALLDFLQSTYEAAAIAANWDRDALECEPGKPGVVRQV